MKRLFSFITLFLGLELFAFTLSDAKLRTLSSHPTWLKLLHYEQGGSSSVLDKNFFLDSHGATDPKKELAETIAAYFRPFDLQDPNQHPRCRFPARYFWLSSQISLPEYESVESQCSDLSQWKLLKNTDSISVVFVSGYLGNPASAFGHSFIKINQGNNAQSDLFDTSISYGALLPPKYHMAEYILKGLFGGYKAAYSDKYYYNEDVVYSNHEFRDMWEYRLALSEDQKKFFLLHAWELIGNKFQYFFLNRNCGYKVSEFLELLYEEPLIKSAKVWYAPIETFYRLKELDQQNKGSVIQKITYIPSAQQTLYQKYEGLSDLEQEIVGVMIDQKLKSLPREYAQTSKATQSHIFDFLLRYYEYSFGHDTKKMTTQNKEFQRQLILKRLQLPASTQKVQEHDKKEKVAIITENNQPSYLGLGVNREKGQHATLFKFAPFAIEQEGVNNLNGDELVVFDTSVSLHDNEVSLKAFDLIRIQRFKTKQMPFDGSNPFSWNLHIGTLKEKKRDYFADVGMGLAWDVTKHIKFASMLNLSVHSDQRQYRYKPNLMMYVNYDDLRMSVGYGYEGDVQKEVLNEMNSILNFELQYRVQDDLSFFMDYQTHNRNRAEMGLKWYYH